MFKKYFLSLFILFFSAHVSFGMNAEEAKNIMLQDYVKHINEHDYKTINKIAELYKIDKNYETNKILLKNSIKSTDDYYIKGLYGQSKELIMYNIQYKYENLPGPLRFNYDCDGKLVALSLGYIGDYGDKRDNYYFIYTYLYPENKIYSVTLLTEDQEFGFNIIDGEFIYVK